MIDEQSSRVYILSWNAKELLCHDLNTGDLTVAALPFEGMNEVVAWKQDKEDNALWEIPAGNLSLKTLIFQQAPGEAEWILFMLSKMDSSNRSSL